MKKFTLLAAAGAGYVLGTRAGRERYEQIRSGAQRFARNPHVRSATHKATDTVGHQVGVAAVVAKDKAAAAASAAAGKVRRDSPTVAEPTVDTPPVTVTPPITPTLD